MSMILVESEIGRYDWSAYRCGCGRSAQHVRDEFLAFAALADQAADPPVPSLDGHVYGSTIVHEPAPIVVSVLLAALAGDVPAETRRRCLEALLFIVAGEGVPVGAAVDFVSESSAAARAGTWLLYREIAESPNVGAASYAYEILSLIEESPHRLRELRPRLAGRISFDLLMDDD